MRTAKPITIVGGGLAGLTLGIGLRQRNVPVTIMEAGSYPRHRVCGEFISGRGQGTLKRLGLLELVEQSDATTAQTVAFFSATQSGPARTLPEKAICVSRFVLDALLAQRFRELGGDLMENHRYAGEFGEGQIRATGRRPKSGKQSGKIGLKIHARKVALTADLEMHAFSNGYVGLCRINPDEVNVCGLFYGAVDKDGKPKPAREWLYGPAGSPLNRRLAGAKFEHDSFCAVAGLSLQPNRAADRAEVCIGDAITMISPMTGNGMSMAFESAELAIAPLAAWNDAAITWSEARRKIAQSCDAAFSTRLAWAKWLHRLMLMPKLQNPLVSLMGNSGLFQRMAFGYTR